MVTNSSSTFYLKYRPQSLDYLIGQEAVKKTLLSAFASNKLSHAYLFVGPRGTGKTSTARILAKMVNCLEANPPCNKCNSCISITDGSFLDLIEIDAASNRGIDDIRTLRERIKLAPSGGKKKVYIIDEVHMLTTEAFNALLKTLEEPPAHALFILATTEGHKVPQTIMSRVQRLDFKLATPMELKTALQKIATEEKIDIDENGLQLLVKKAEGSFRDGVKFLDQVATFSQKVTAQVIEEGLKSSSFDDLISLSESLSQKNSKQALLAVSAIVSTGVDMKDTICCLMDIFRNLVLMKNDLGEVLVKPQWGEQKYEALKRLAEKFSLDDLVFALDNLQIGLERLKTASIISLPLELVVVEICAGKKLINTGIEIAPKQPQKEEIDKKLVSSELSLQEPTIELPVAATLTTSADNVVANSPDILKIKDKWTFVLETIRPYNFSLEALLRSVNITECSERTVVIEVPYSFHQRILEVPKNKDILESILSEIVGRSIRISTVLGQRPPRREDIANIEVAADDEIIRAAAEIFNSDTVN